jgi:hypothetical protein
MAMLSRDRGSSSLALGAITRVSACRRTARAEVALALTRLLAPEEATGVVAWLNVAGALAGTPLAGERLAGARLPESIAVINLVALPTTLGGECARPRRRNTPRRH